jgi:hypothetical protein
VVPELEQQEEDKGLVDQERDPPAPVGPRVGQRVEEPHGLDE